MYKIRFLWLVLLWTHTFCQTTFEFNTGSKRFGIDWISSYDFGTKKQWNVFNRSRAVAYYSNRSTSFLSVNTVSYNFPSRLGFTGNVIADNDRMYGSVGLQAEKIWKPWYFYVLATYAFLPVPYQEDYLFVIRTIDLTSKTKLVIHTEFYFSFSYWHNDQSLQRIKVGIQHGMIQIGCISETYEAGRTWRGALQNIGFYCKRYF